MKRILLVLLVIFTFTTLSFGSFYMGYELSLNKPSFVATSVSEVTLKADSALSSGTLFFGYEIAGMISPELFLSLDSVHKGGTMESAGTTVAWEPTDSKDYMHFGGLGLRVKISPIKAGIVVPYGLIGYARYGLLDTQSPWSGVRGDDLDLGAGLELRFSGLAVGAKIVYSMPMSGEWIINEAVDPSIDVKLSNLSITFLSLAYHF